MTDPTEDERPALPPRPQPLGGALHEYLGYDPVRFGSARPTAAGDAARGAFEHLLAMGSMRRFTDEELADAIRIDPSQIQGLGPSIDALIALLEERRRKILATFDPAPAAREAARAFERAAEGAVDPATPSAVRDRIARAVAEGQLRDLERLWYRLPEGSRAQVRLTHALERLRERFEVDGMASRWPFTGREALDVPRALEVMAELEEIERLLELRLHLE
ncbi:MAG: hypothetical protein ACKOTD_07020, partial [Phycisphaerales bacterium]